MTLARTADTGVADGDLSLTYMLLIMEPPGQRAERGVEEGREAYARMMDFAAALQARGLLIGANALKDAATGTRVRQRNGQRSVVDGPFADTKEMLGGYYLLDTSDRDEALAIAADCPAAAWCDIEVREIGTCYE